MAKDKSTATRTSKPATPEKAISKIAVLLAPFDKDSRKRIMKGANAFLRLANKMGGR